MPAEWEDEEERFMRSCVSAISIGQAAATTPTLNSLLEAYIVGGCSVFLKMQLFLEMLHLQLTFLAIT